MDCPICGYGFDSIEESPDPNEICEGNWVDVECLDCGNVFRAKWEWITEEKEESEE